MKYLRIAPLIFALTIALSACSQAQKKTTARKPFSLPEIPSVITTPQGKADFMTTHYWDNYDFADTSLVRKPQISEQIFVDYINMIPQSAPEVVKTGVDTLLNRAFRADSIVFACFTELAEKYLYDPNSPFMNEELFVPFLQFIVNSPRISEIDKIRPQYQLEMAYKNRVGDIAIDFEYVTDKGQKGRMHDLKADYTILYFNNPGCGECKRTSAYASGSAILNNIFFVKSKTASSKPLVLLAVYPDSDIDAWKAESYNGKWINSRATGGFKEADVYDLKAIPSLYLLDKDKKVILKDANIQKIEAWLNENASL